MSIATGLISGVIGVVLAVILVANVLMPQIKDTNTSTWSTSEVALFSLTGLISVAGILYGVGSVFGVV